METGMHVSHGCSRRLAVSLTLLFLLSEAAFTQTTGGVYSLNVDQAVMLRNRKLEPAKPWKNAFGPAQDAVHVYNGEQARWTCRDIPEGDYHLDLPVAWRDYLGFAEMLPARLRVYHNDTLLRWKGHTFPAKPDQALTRDYVARMVVRNPIHLKPGDVLRIVGGHTAVGALRLSAIGPPVDQELPQPFVQMPGRTETEWLDLDWEPTVRDGSNVTQACWLFNPGTTPRSVRLKVEARDYLMTPLLDGYETVVVPPCERVVKTYAFKTGAGGRTRLALTASAEGFAPVHHRSRFFVDDITAGPRPRTSLNGAWEMCYAPGVDPGEAPPADARWTPCVVPALQENKLGHCMWFRRDFTSPAHIAGERMVVSFGQVLSESWLYVNGKRVHYQFDGAEPFEADVTDVWQPGKTNRILLAVRDWIAYSPRNRERILRGEEPISKEGMIAPSGYVASGTWGGCMGMGQPVYLEARPAVAVADVSIATSLRDRKLSLVYRLINRSAGKAGVSVAPAILDAGKELERLDTQTVAIEPGGAAEVTFELPWPRGVTLWQPGAPYLYVLQTELTGAAGVADRHIQRFGFRDIRIDGIHFIVNGTRMKIRSSWASGASGVGETRSLTDLGKRLEAVWDKQMRSMHNNDIQLSRTHNCTGVRDILDIADETGLMIKPENGSFCQQSFSFDQLFWTNAIASEVRMVEVYRNHPSAWMWSAGNENMWGWLYQGEATRTLGNRRQVEVVRAMRQADPQARPIEWEADGDLMGKWDYHQLHYPRELSRSPEVPVSAWWGPLDGKTVIPYSMGPITLGEKPLTDGEAFWPATLNHPFGGTILLGDRALQGGASQWSAWTESSQYFVNGFRDVEFALIDTYTPLSMVRPQAVVLKEETAEFYGGRTLVRHLNVHSDVPHAAKLTLAWTLRTAAGRTLDSGRQRLALGPAELKRLEIKVRLPAVKQDMPATFEVRLLGAGKQVVHEVRRPWLISAPASLKVPSALKLSLYDPQGATAAMLASLGVPFTLMPTLQAPQGGALILGRDAVKLAAQGPWREQLMSFVRGGGKLVILEQAESFDFLPFPVTLAPKTSSTIAFVRAAGHPLLRGIADDQLRWWADDHYVSRGNYRKPVNGNVLPLVDVGTMDGLLEAPLMEEYFGRGSILLCQMLLTEKAATTPVAGRLLQNLLDYLAMPAVHRQPGKTALLAGTNERLRTALTQNKLVFESPADPVADLRASQYRLAIIDVGSALNETTARALKAFAEEGGNVLLHRATPAQKPLLEALLGVGLVFTDVASEASGDVQYRLLRRGQGGLLDGISNHEFLWPSKTALAELRKEGRWWSVLKVPAEEYVADYFCGPVAADAARVLPLTDPCALLAVPAGKGMIVLNQLRLDQPVADVAQTAGRLRSLLLTNLGGTLQGQETGTLPRAERLKRYAFFPVSLAAYANRGLKDDKASGLIGWTNQGDNDMRGLPTGNQTFAGVPFQIPAPKSVITLYSTSCNNRDLPKEVRNIAVNRRADTLFFLHSLAYAGEAKPFMYRVNYKDGASVEVPITEGCQVFDWWDEPSRHAENMAANGTVVGFAGDNPLRKGALVLLYEWVNPHPDKEIAGVDFARVNEYYNAVPVMVGLTAAMLQSNEGVVTDVIGVHGVKVRLGTQNVDVHYIGVAALDEKHPFYGQALAAHRAMVVGRKVKVQDDVVTLNATGQRMAYVFLSEGDTELRNLINARLIGDGLGKLGNFEGNTRHRMYLENLGFISSQGKKGLWAKEAK
jgi:hypothetical protein